MKKFFPVFKVGSYPQGTYTDDDLREIFEKYDPAWLSAPFTTDHKKDGPASGYAKTLKFENGTLYASSEDMNDELRQAVKNKQFGRVSVEMYKDLEGKGRYLKAISFLGVKTPQVKGLEGDIQSIDFKEGESEAIAFFADFNSDEEIFELGDVVADPAAEEEEEESAKPSAAQNKSGEEPPAGEEEESEKPAAEPGEKPDDAPASENFEELQSRIEQLEQEKQSLESKFEQTEAERRQAQERLGELEVDLQKNRFEQWLNERIAYGSVPPAQKDKIMELLMALDSVEEFDHYGEGGTPLQMFQDFVEKLPKVIDEEEKVKKGEEAMDFTDGGILGKAAEEYMEQERKNGRKVSAVDAVRFITQNKQ